MSSEKKGERRAKIIGEKTKEISRETVEKKATSKGKEAKKRQEDRRKINRMD